ncbi:MAG: copper resistance CopC family protein [Candidatus Nanopelagicales bacterium]
MLPRVGAIAAITLAASSMLTAPAIAHAALDRITPADGAVLQEPPADIKLVFNERLIEASVKVVVSNRSGDAHPITGSSTFTLDTAPTTSTSAPVGGNPLAPPPSSPAAGMTSAPPGQASPLEGWRPMAAIVLGLAGGVGIVLWLRRRKA